MKTNKYANKLADELSNCGKTAIFEIEVFSNISKENEFILCEIYVGDDSICCQRDALTTKESEGIYIAESSVEIDECFSLDEHLQELHDTVTNEIINGDLYELAY